MLFELFSGAREHVVDKEDFLYLAFISLLSTLPVRCYQEYINSLCTLGITDFHFHTLYLTMATFDDSQSFAEILQDSSFHSQPESPEVSVVEGKPSHEECFVEEVRRYGCLWDKTSTHNKDK